MPISSDIGKIGKGYFRLVPIWRQPCRQVLNSPTLPIIGVQELLLSVPLLRSGLSWPCYSCRTERWTGLPSPLKTATGNRKNATVVSRSMVWHGEVHLEHLHHGRYAVLVFSPRKGHEEAPRGELPLCGWGISQLYLACNHRAFRTLRAGEDQHFSPPSS